MFNYSTVIDGQRKRITMPYDPTDIGFLFDHRSDCCLYFKKGEFLIRVKMGSHMLLMYPKNGKGRNLITPGYIPSSTSHLREKIKEWI